jgi:hydrogenase-4 membrane subunit HyfE
MRLYALYVLLIASIVIASVAATPGLNERLRRWLIIGVALLVIAPVTLFLLFG